MCIRDRSAYSPHLKARLLALVYLERMDFCCWSVEYVLFKRNELIVYVASCCHWQIYPSGLIDGDKTTEVIAGAVTRHLPSPFASFLSSSLLFYHPIAHPGCDLMFNSYCKNSRNGTISLAVSWSRKTASILHHFRTLLMSGDWCGTRDCLWRSCRSEYTLYFPKYCIEKCFKIAEIIFTVIKVIGNTL